MPPASPSTAIRDRRAALVRRAIRMVHDEAVDIPIWDSVSEYAMSARFAYAPLQQRNAVLTLAGVSPAR